ncbi:hypothetical protein FB157_13953 [Streptomyces sp. BK340]|nr:hypothetical protein FB157_13953 [Streptomyces sp. BK340]
MPSGSSVGPGPTVPDEPDRTDVRGILRRLPRPPGSAGKCSQGGAPVPRCVPPVPRRRMSMAVPDNGAHHHDPTGRAAPGPRPDRRPVRHRGRRGPSGHGRPQGARRVRGRAPAPRSPRSPSSPTPRPARSTRSPTTPSPPASQSSTLYSRQPCPGPRADSGFDALTHAGSSSTRGSRTPRAWPAGPCAIPRPGAGSWRCAASSAATRPIRAPSASSPSPPPRIPEEKDPQVHDRDP